MSSHVFSELFFHFNWHTHGDQKVLLPDVEHTVHDLIRNRCRETKGVYFHAIGGTETHIHLAIRSEPDVTISTLVGAIKGASSFETNKHFGRTLLAWQRGYGVVTFSKKNLPWVLDYIANQKEHHAAGTVIPVLETHEQDDESPTTG